MARTTRQAPPTTKPRKDPAYEPKRVDDKPVFWAYSIVDRLTWPITVFFLLFIGGISAVWLRFGEARAVALMSFLQDNVFYAVVSLLAMATVAVLRKVPQLGRFEKRQAATQQEVEQARAVSEQVLQAVKAAPAAGDRVDPTPSEVLRIVQGLQSAVGEIQRNAAAAAQNSTAAVDAVAGYGRSLQTIASGVSTITGPTPAQQPAQQPAQRPPEAVPDAEWPGSTYGRPEARYEPGEPREDWSRRDGSHRALTAQHAAVPSRDEQEDWQEPADEGPGLDTSLIRGFRADMARADADERAARKARPAGPAPIWPGIQPVDDDLPPHIREAKRRATEQMRRERAEYWSNPEEGPQ